MPGNYSRVFVESTGNTIYASNYNAEHDNHITNHTLDTIDDASSSLTAYRAVTDPGESGTESLPTSGTGEIQRLRKVLVEVTGKTYWYESPALSTQTLANAVSINTTTNDVTLTNNLTVTSGITANSLAVNTLNFTGNALVLNGVASNTFTSISVNSSSSMDAALQLNRGGEVWQVNVDTNADLLLSWNNTPHVTIKNSDNVNLITIQPNVIPVGDTPIRNTIYPQNIIKAWGRISSNTLQDGFNVNTVSSNSGGQHQVTLFSSVDATRSCIVASLGPSSDASPFVVKVTATATNGNGGINGYTFRVVDAGGTGESTGIVSFIVVGV